MKKIKKTKSRSRAPVVHADQSNTSTSSSSPESRSSSSSSTSPPSSSSSNDGAGAGLLSELLGSQIGSLAEDAQLASAFRNASVRGASALAVKALFQELGGTSTSPDSFIPRYRRPGSIERPLNVIRLAAGIGLLLPEVIHIFLGGRQV